MPDYSSDAAPPKSLVVTIDGPAGTGKSTVARELARELTFDFLDTGAMYRAVGAACLAENRDPDDADAATRTAHELRYDPKTGAFLGLSGSLRSLEVTEAASRVAQHADVRARLVDWQRQFADGRRVVTEGRDQGTDVFPDAACKYFLTATPEERAHRRVQELTRMGREVDFQTVLDQIRARDDRDQNRVVSPLRPADDAVEIDTTSVTIADVVEQLATDVRRVLNDG